MDGRSIVGCCLLLLWPNGARCRQWWSVTQATHLPPPVLYLNLAAHQLHISGADQALAALRTGPIQYLGRQYLPQWTMCDKPAMLQFRDIKRVLVYWCILCDRGGGVLVHRFGGGVLGRNVRCHLGALLLSQGSLPLIRLSDTCTNAHQAALLNCCSTLPLSC